MIKFKEKIYVLPAAVTGLANGAMIASLPIGMIQAHNQGKQAEEAAEEQARLQKKMNAQLKRIADSEDQNKGQEAAAVLQGQQAFSELSQDVGEDLSNGVKKAGNTVGGAVGGLTGAAGGAIGGALAGKAAVAASNKFLGTTLAKGGRYGALAGTVMGGILGAQSGSSLFSERRVGSVLYSDINITSSDIDTLSRNAERLQSIRKPGIPSQSVLATDLDQVTQRSFAAAGELAKMGKGLWNVAKQHKGTVAEGLASGLAMGGAGYAANKIINKDQDEGKSAKSTLAKIGIGTLGVLGTSMALKKGVNYKMIAKNNKTLGNVIKRGASAAQVGAGFGGLMTAVPLMTKMSQESQMKADTAGDQEKKGSGLGKKLLIGGALAAGAAVGGGKLIQKFGPNTGLAKGITKFEKNIAGKVESGKESILRKIGNEDAVKARQEYKQSLLDKKSATAENSWKNAEDWNKRTDGVVSGATQLMGSGREKTQRLVEQIKEQGDALGSKNLTNAAKWLEGHKKTAMLAAVPAGYAATFGSWQLGEDLVKKPLKKLDPGAYRNEEEEQQ